MKPVQKKDKYNRAERRQIETLDAKLDELVNKYIKTRAEKGLGSELNNLARALDTQWKTFCHKQNSSTKSHIKADPEAFTRQIEARKEIEAQINIAILEEAEKNKYDEWVAKMEQYFPWRLKWFKLVNRLKRGDHVKETWQRFQGESPRGTWF